MLKGIDIELKSLECNQQWCRANKIEKYANFEHELFMNLSFVSIFYKKY